MIRPHLGDKYGVNYDLNILSLKNTHTDEQSHQRHAYTPGERPPQC